MKNSIVKSLLCAVAMHTTIPTHAEQIQANAQEKVQTFLVRPKSPYDTHWNIDFWILQANISLSQCTGNNNFEKCRNNLAYQRSESFPEIDMEEVCTWNKLCTQDLAIFLDSDEVIQHPKFKESLDEGDLNILIQAFIAGWNYPMSEEWKNDRSNDIFHYLNRLSHVSGVYADWVVEKYNCNVKYPCMDQKLALYLIAKKYFTQWVELRIAKYQLPMPKYKIQSIDRSLFDK